MRFNTSTLTTTATGSRTTYHRNAAEVGLPTTWPNPFPGWDRMNPDYDAWLANLRAAGIEILVVTRVNVEEGSQNAADKELFPIERIWADRHPAIFPPIFGHDTPGSRIKIFQVIPPRDFRESPTDRSARSH